MRVFRLILLFCLAIVASLSPIFAQEPKGDAKQDAGSGGPKNTNLFTTIRPDLFIVVRKHPTGADLVEVTMVDPAYPRELLRSQIKRLSELLKSEPRGLYVTDPRSRNYEGSIKATFGIDGIIQDGRFQLTPVAQAFAGAPKENEISGLSIVFEKTRPTAETVRDFRSESVDVQADAPPGSIGIEYRIAIKDQDPSNIDIPDSALAAAKPANQIVQKTGPDMSLYGLVAVAALAVGALVYSLTLRRPRQR